MTSTETLALVRTLLDDGLLAVTGKDAAIDAINQAQLHVLRLSVASNDESCLRPLYWSSANLVNGATIPDDVLYARGFLIKDKVPCVYMSYPEYLTTYHANQLGDSPYARHRTFSIANKKVYFSTVILDPGQEDETGTLHYIKTPTPFSDTQELMLPSEYHPFVALVAASLLSGMDIGEQARSGIEQFGVIPTPQQMSQASRAERTESLSQQS